MNHGQKLILVLALIAIASMVIYPPWRYIDDDGHKQNLGYGLLWKPPVHEKTAQANILGIKIKLDLDRQKANSIDFSQLLLQVAGVGILAFGLVAIMRRNTSTS